MAFSLRTLFRRGGSDGNDAGKEREVNTTGLVLAFHGAEARESAAEPQPNRPHPSPMNSTSPFQTAGGEGFSVREMSILIPPQFVAPGRVFGDQVLALPMEDLRRTFQQGRPSLRLSQVFQLCPEVFVRQVREHEDVDVVLPYQKVRRLLDGSAHPPPFPSPFGMAGSGGPANEMHPWPPGRESSRPAPRVVESPFAVAPMTALSGAQGGHAGNAPLGFPDTAAMPQARPQEVVSPFPPMEAERPAALGGASTFLPAPPATGAGSPFQMAGPAGLSAHPKTSAPANPHQAEPAPQPVFAAVGTASAPRPPAVPVPGAVSPFVTTPGIPTPGTPSPFQVITPHTANAEGPKAPATPGGDGRPDFVSQQHTVGTGSAASHPVPAGDVLQPLQPMDRPVSVPVVRRTDPPVPGMPTAGAEPPRAQPESPASTQNLPAAPEHPVQPVASQEPEMLTLSLAAVLRNASGRDLGFNPANVPPSVEVKLPVQTVVSQLASGKIAVPVALLQQGVMRQFRGAFAHAREGLAVVVPLSEILPLVPPALLSQAPPASTASAESLTTAGIATPFSAVATEDATQVPRPEESAPLANAVISQPAEQRQDPLTPFSDNADLGVPQRAETLSTAPPDDFRSGQPMAPPQAPPAVPRPAATPSATEAPPAKPRGEALTFGCQADVRHIATRAIFDTERVLTPQEIADRSARFPGICACVIITAAGMAQSSGPEECEEVRGFSAAAPQSYRYLKGLAESLGMADQGTFTLRADKSIRSFFLEPGVCLAVLHSEPGFRPGVREKLILVTRELGGQPG